MSQTNCPGKEGFWKDERGLGLADSPYMIFLAIIIIAFVTVYGIYLAKNFMDVQSHASAVDAAERIYNAADLLSAGAPDSTKTLWVKVPAGYEIDIDGNITLRSAGSVVGTPLHIKGVELDGQTLTGGERYHLKLRYTAEDGRAKIVVSRIA